MGAPAVWCPVSGRPPRGLTPTCSKGGVTLQLCSWRDTWPALQLGLLGLSVGSLWALLVPGETVVCHADAHTGTYSLASLVQCSLFFFARC